MNESPVTQSYERPMGFYIGEICTKKLVRERVLQKKITDEIYSKPEGHEKLSLNQN